jgi:hypothetical protein
MKRLLIAFFAGLMLVFSCTGNKAGQTVDGLSDSTAIDSSELAEPIDSMELLITETPMPRAADAMFDDFLFNFLANKKLQKERIIFPLKLVEGEKTELMEKSKWKMEHLFMRQGFYTLLFNNDKQMSLMKDTAVSEAVVERILLRKAKVKEYHFLRIKGAWMLTEVRTTPLKDNANASFLSFYKQFASDSLFQLKSLNETVQFVGPDPDDDFSVMEGIITPDTWEAFAPELPSRMIYNIIYGDAKKETNSKLFVLRGIANGQELEMTFKRKDGKWLLTKLAT